MVDTTINILSPSTSSPTTQISPTTNAFRLYYQSLSVSRRLEYLVYLLYVSFALSTIITTAYHACAGATLSYRLYPSFVPEWRIDLSDHQWRFFYNNLPTLIYISIGYLYASDLVRHLSSRSPNRIQLEVYFRICFSLIFMIIVNGSCILFILFIVTVNYAAAKYTTGRNALGYFTWTYVVVVLLANEYYDGYSWRSLFHWLYKLTNSETVLQLLKTLDSYRGVATWHVLFNLVCLRMISFNFDWHWAIQSHHGIAGPSASYLASESIIANSSQQLPQLFEDHASKCFDCKIGGLDSPCLRWREKLVHPLNFYNYLFYLSYLFYFPLYLAGPIITFNSCTSHLLSPQMRYSRNYLFKYAFRLCIAFAIFLIFLHTIPLYALIATKSYLKLSSFELACVALLFLLYLWLKFLSIWRFSRLTALADGIESDENMQRCVLNNYSVSSFWRTWHTSFNRWIIRYIYIPLGGGWRPSSSIAQSSATTEVEETQSLLSKPVSIPRTSFLSKFHFLIRLRNILIVFVFVAFWHDRTLQLLTWGVFIALSFFPEIFVTHLVNSSPTLKILRNRWYWRHICALGAACNILLLVIGNLIGYSIGIDGTFAAVDSVFVDGSLMLFTGIFLSLFSAAQIMFAIRDLEKRIKEEKVEQLSSMD